MKNLLLSAADIQTMSYPDFIGAMGLENTTLGGGFSVDYWISKSKMHKYSKVLEIACSTGFNLRKCTGKVQACGVGIDKSKLSVQCAIKKSMEEKTDRRIQFQVGDVEKLPFPLNYFNHVIAGMGFAFIDQKYKVLEEVCRVLKPQGYLLTVTSVYKTKPEKAFLKKIKNTFDLKLPDGWGYREWHRFFSTFFILKDEMSLVFPAKGYSFKKEVFDYALHGDHNLQHSSLEVKQACAKRLLDIHLIINKNIVCQVGKVQVWQLS